jgi:small subunit ribosomal protein S1
MTTENQACEERGGVPPPLGEGWWNAVLQEEQRYSPVGRRKCDTQARDRENEKGSPEDWAWARALYDADDTVELPVIGCNRGGVLVEARGLRGFVPISHLLDVPPSHAGEERSACLALLVGKSLHLKVIEFDPERGRLVLSERAAQAGPGKRLEILSRLQPGHRVRGRVTNITRFGVFVELGGVEGLIHVSELSWGRVRHPEDVASVGEELEVEVISVDAEQGRVGLSLKELLPDPWASVAEKYHLGDEIEGEVTNVVKFGAFVAVEEGLEGLIHVSELGEGDFPDPRGVLEEGDRVVARIIHIDALERRLGLSLRNVAQDACQDSDLAATHEHERLLPSL